MDLKSTSFIVLSGGASSRFGSDKSKALIQGRSLISRILESIPDEIDVIIVGPDPGIQSHAYRCIQESPQGGGPVAGFKAGIEICQSDIVALVATDMPFAVIHILNLMNMMDSDSVMYIDNEGFRQPLAAVYRVEAVNNAFNILGNIQGLSMNEFISHLDIVDIAMSADVAHSLRDIDTPTDLEVAIAFADKLMDNPSL